ncbi:MAG: hypothetical protein JSS60_08650 [Verrucomicrobia bacterium]|nr:hypothetical protein [Verrucomicrobiota bacterium]
MMTTATTATPITWGITTDAATWHNPDTTWDYGTQPTTRYNPDTTWDYGTQPSTRYNPVTTWAYTSDAYMTNPNTGFSPWSISNLGAQLPEPLKSVIETLTQIFTQFINEMRSLIDEARRAAADLRNARGINPVTMDPSTTAVYSNYGTTYGGVTTF